MEHLNALEEPFVAAGSRGQLISELIEIAHALRRASEEADTETIKHGLRTCHGTIGALIARPDNVISQVAHLRQVLSHHQEQIEILSSSAAALSELRLQTLAYHYLFEGIPSQLFAAIEERQLASGQRPTRFQLLNALIEERAIKSYLEIGCCTDDCFNQVHCAQRVGVDPNSGGTLRMTSDQFFAVNVQKFDLIFIDGLHEAWQVDRDIVNALNCLLPNGIVVMHDCNPLFDVRTLVPRVSETWNGDVWRSFVQARSRLDLDCAVGRFDHGCGVIIPRRNSDPIEPVSASELVWTNLCKNRTRWLRPMELPELLAWIRGSTNKS